MNRSVALVVVAAVLCSLTVICIFKFSDKLGDKNASYKTETSPLIPSNVVVFRNVRGAVIDKDNLLLTDLGQDDRDSQVMAVTNLSEFTKQIDNPQGIDLHAKLEGHKWRIVEIKQATYISIAKSI